MKKFAIALGAAAAMAFAPAASADGLDEIMGPNHGWFFEVGAGAWLGEKPNHQINTFAVDDEYDPDGVFTLMFATGSHVTENIRAEFNFSWTSGGDGDYLGLPHRGDFDAFTFIVNGIYEIDLGMPVQPFVGGGLGLALVDVNDIGAIGGGFTTDDSDSALIVNGIVGLDFALNEMITLTTRYTIGWMDSMTFDTTIAGQTSRQDDQIVHAVTAGIRININ